MVIYYITYTLKNFTYIIYDMTVLENISYTYSLTSITDSYTNLLLFLVSISRLTNDKNNSHNIFYTDPQSAGTALSSCAESHPTGYYLMAGNSVTISSTVLAFHLPLGLLWKMKNLFFILLFVNVNVNVFMCVYVPGHR